MQQPIYDFQSQLISDTDIVFVVRAGLIRLNLGLYYYDSATLQWRTRDFLMREDGKLDFKVYHITHSPISPNHHHSPVTTHYSNNRI